MGREFIGRVVIGCGALLLPLSAGAAFAAGRSALLGVLVGGGLVLANLFWLTRGGGRGLEMRGGRALWVLTLGLRYLALFAALGLALWSGQVHPLGLIAGLSVLPPVLVFQGLVDARRSP